jgi:hypothetical protein
MYCTIASGPCQSSNSWVEVPQNSRPYLTVSSETPPTWRARSSYLYPPGTGWPSYTPGHCVPFLSPLTTRRATVEVFLPASIRVTELREYIYRPCIKAIRFPRTCPRWAMCNGRFFIAASGLRAPQMWHSERNTGMTIIT